MPSSKLDRRTALQALLTVPASLSACTPACPPQPSKTPARAFTQAPTNFDTQAPPSDFSHLRWARGVENQRKADLGNGQFLNPIIPGDHPDPSLLRVGSDYYLTFSSFDAYPGLKLWHSKDLVNWQPIGAALRTPIGSVWAPQLVLHQSTYYLYVPAKAPGYRSIYVLSAPSIRGPWSEPIDLRLHEHIDPGHAVGEDGKRYLFLSGGDRVRLSDDGLSTVGPIEHVYDPWHYPKQWVVESFSPEGPKICRRGEWYYLVTAVGGTAGPPTGHMVIAARSRSIHGPWENAPHNPLVRTQSKREKWWSRGHATLVDAPDGSWWMLYHGYENGFWTLGRQTLLDPVVWNAAGWPEARGGDLSKPLDKPAGGEPVPHGLALSDDFNEGRLGIQWAFYDPEPNEGARASYVEGALVLQAKGSEPKDASPLCFIVGDLGYEVETQFDIEDGAEAGLVLFYNRRLYCGLGIAADRVVMHRYGLPRRLPKPPDLAGHIYLRCTNDQHIVTFEHSPDGVVWTKFDVQMEVSGYHHNVAYDFLSLRPGLYVTGAGRARFKSVTYRAL